MDLLARDVDPIEHLLARAPHGRLADNRLFAHHTVDRDGWHGRSLPCSRGGTKAELLSPFHTAGVTQQSPGSRRSRAPWEPNAPPTKPRRGLTTDHASIPHVPFVDSHTVLRTDSTKLVLETFRSVVFNLVGDVPP